MSEFEQPLAATHTTTDAHTHNVAGLERTLSVIGGGLLLGNGLRQGGIGGWSQVLLGGLLAARGISQHCAIKQSLTPSPWEEQLRREYGWHNLEACMRSVTVGKTRSEVFEFLRDTSKLAEVLERVQSLEQIEPNRYRWSVEGPLGKPLQSFARLEEVRDNQQLVWVSEAGARLPLRCTISLTDAPQGRGTEIKVVLACEPPAGVLGYAGASLLSPLLGGLLTRELRRIKQYLETGEVALSRSADSGRQPREELRQSAPEQARWPEQEPANWEVQP